MPENAVLPQIDQIEILDLLGSGGMSLVYRARQKNLDRVVAVKVLAKEAIAGASALERFQQEARLTASLVHPNIAKTLAFGVSSDGQPYIVMEFLAGKTLKEYLKTEKMPLGKFRDIFLPLLSALDAAHSRNLIHRDIKPENIMICQKDDGTELVKLLDFGIAKVMVGDAGAQSLTGTGVLLGSPSYMSPEQCSGKTLDQRSDIYSISCVMYEALSGEAPFTAASALELMHKHISEPAPTVSEFSRKVDIRRELAELTLSGLAKDPSARPQSPRELAKKLSDVLEKVTLERVPIFERKKKQRKTAVVLGLIFFVAAASSATLIVVQHKSRKSVHIAELSERLDQMIANNDSSKVSLLVDEALADDGFKECSRSKKISWLDKYFEKLSAPEYESVRLLLANQLLFQLVRQAGDLVKPEPDSQFLPRIRRLVPYLIEHEKSPRNWRQMDWVIDSERGNRNRLSQYGRAGEFLYELTANSSLRGSTSLSADDYAHAVSGYIYAADAALKNGHFENYKRLMNEAEKLSLQHINRESQHYHTIRAQEYLWERRLDKAARELESAKKLCEDSAYGIPEYQIDQRKRAECKLSALRKGEIPDDETAERKAGPPSCGFEHWFFKHAANKTP